MMLSKLLRTGQRLRSSLRIVPKLVNRPIVRIYSHLVPPNQYDTPIPRNLHFGYALSVHWELWPLLVVTVIVYMVLLIAILWALQNKVDVVYSTNTRANISRTMDLRYPTIHKMVVINQVYEPWPEMYDVLEKMKAAEKRAISRAQSCNYP